MLPRETPSMTVAASASALPGARPQVDIILDLGGRSKGSPQCGIEKTPSVTLMAASMALPDMRPRVTNILNLSCRRMSSVRCGIGQKTLSSASVEEARTLPSVASRELHP